MPHGGAATHSTSSTLTSQAKSANSTTSSAGGGETDLLGGTNKSLLIICLTSTVGFLLSLACAVLITYYKRRQKRRELKEPSVVMRRWKRLHEQRPSISRPVLQNTEGGLLDAQEGCEAPALPIAASPLLSTRPSPPIRGDSQRRIPRKRAPRLDAHGSQSHIIADIPLEAELPIDPEKMTDYFGPHMTKAPEMSGVQGLWSSTEDLGHEDEVLSVVQEPHIKSPISVHSTALSHASSLPSMYAGPGPLIMDTPTSSIMFPRRPFDIDGTHASSVSQQAADHDLRVSLYPETPSDPGRSFSIQPTSTRRPLRMSDFPMDVCD